MTTDGAKTRREFVQACGLAAGTLALSGAVPRALLAATEPEHPEIPNENVAKVYRECFGGRPITKGQLSLDMPLIAEDGRVVPVIIESALPMAEGEYVKTVRLIVDHNPDALLASFHLTPGMGRVELSTRIKMKRTTWVRAIAETSDGRLFADYAKVNVTLNGCG